MTERVQRRQTTPNTAIRLWTAIAYIRQQKQIPNQERVERYMQREHELTVEETKNQLHAAIEDELIVAYTALACKGSKAGSKQEGFKLPDMDDPNYVCRHTAVL